MGVSATIEFLSQGHDCSSRPPTQVSTEFWLNIALIDEDCAGCIKEWTVHELKVGIPFLWIALYCPVFNHLLGEAELAKAGADLTVGVVESPVSQLNPHLGDMELGPAGYKSVEVFHSSGVSDRLPGPRRRLRLSSGLPSRKRACTRVHQLGTSGLRFRSIAGISSGAHWVVSTNAAIVAATAPQTDDPLTMPPLAQGSPCDGQDAGGGGG